GWRFAGHPRTRVAVATTPTVMTPSLVPSTAVSAGLRARAGRRSVRHHWSLQQWRLRPVGGVHRAEFQAAEREGPSSTTLAKEKRSATGRAGDDHGQRHEVGPAFPATNA